MEAFCEMPLETVDCSLVRLLFLAFGHVLGGAGETERIEDRTRRIGEVGWDGCERFLESANEGVFLFLLCGGGFAVCRFSGGFCGFLRIILSVQAVQRSDHGFFREKAGEDGYACLPVVLFDSDGFEDRRDAASDD